MTRTEAKPPPTNSPTKKRPVVRDGFSMPKEDYDLIESVRDQCWDTKPNKSEVLRAGLIALSEMKQEKMRQAVRKVVKLRPGREPKVRRTKQSETVDRSR